MHFSIPETSERRDGRGSSYTTYEIHINGVRHCSLRYRQLHCLNERLRRDLNPRTLPTFPPKRLMPLAADQVDDRRVGLEKYLQLLAQDQRVVNGLTFNGFLLAAQQETAAESVDEADLDVFLMNDCKIVVRGLTVQQTDEVLEKVCSQLNVPDDCVYHFSLFLIRRRSDDNGITILRKLQDYESPYISQKSLANDSKLVLRKSSWDLVIDDSLLANAATLNLLYIQTLWDVERGWVEASADSQRQMALMQSRGAKKEYMEAARNLPNYGYLHFDPCSCDYPASNTPLEKVLIGGRELVLQFHDNNKVTREKVCFRVTKMRCWRIMTLASGEPTKLELSFEYLMANGELQWVTVVSPQAIIMSLCLQSAVEEILRVRGGIAVKKPPSNPEKTSFKFRKRDGTEVAIPMRAGLRPLQPDKKNSVSNSILGPKYSVKKLSEKFDVVNMKDASRAAEDVLIENEAFINVNRENDDL